MQPAAQKRIGLLGGTFDPIHLGHLILAEQCREQARLDHVWFIPSARPPHKPDRALTPFGQRLEMMALAIAGQPAFRVDELEQERPGPSYTVDTLEVLRQRHPGAAFHWIIGSDCLPDLSSWREPARIVELAGLMVVARPSWPVWTRAQLRAAQHLPGDAALPFQEIHSPLIDISSRDLRRRRAEGRSLRYLVPRAVECYIDAHRLYQKDEKAPA
jgi:nicotinate-nucleotide adenylyltransferase